MKKTLIIAAAVVVVLGAVLVVAPGFVDWNKYKPQIIAQIHDATGLDVAINGDLQLAVLPYPHAVIGGLTVSNPAYAKETLVSLDRAEVSVALVPLFSGKVAVDTVSLVKPDIQVSIAADGTPSWMTPVLQDKMQKKDGAGAAKTENLGEAISLNGVKIKDGAVRYSDARSGKTYTLSGVNLDVDGDTLFGPYDVKGDMTWAGQNVTVAAKLGRVDGEGGSVALQAEVDVPSSSTKMTWSGVVALGEAPEIQGEAALDTASLKSLLDLAAGKDSAPVSLAQPFSARGMLTASAKAVAASNMKVTMAGMQADTTLSINLAAARPTADVAVTVQGPVDLGLFAAAPGKIADAKGGTATGIPAFVPDSMTLPMDMDATFTFAAPAVKSGAMIVNNVKMNGTFKDRKGSGIVSAELPGTGSLNTTFGMVFGSASVSEKTGAVTLSDPVLTYSVDMKANDGAKAVLALLPEEAVGSMLPLLRDGIAVKAAGTVKPAVAVIDSAAVTVQKTNFALAGSYALRRSNGRDMLTLKASTDAIDADAWLARISPAQKKEDAAPPTQSVKDVVAKVALPFDVDVALAAQSVRLKAVDYNAFGLTGQLSGKRLELKSLTLKDAKGNTVTAAGTAGDITALKDLDISVQGATGDVKALLDGFGVQTAGMPASLTTAQGVAEFKGQADNLSFTANVKASGGTLETSGVLANVLDKPEVGSLTLRLQHPNYVDVMRIFNPSFTSSVALKKNLDLFASMKRDGKVYSFPDLQATIGPAVIGGSVKIDTTAAKPAVTVSLQMGDVPLGELLGQSSGVAGGAAKGGVNNKPQAEARWSRDAINTAWMQQVNLTLDATAKSLSWGTWMMDNVVAAATLTDGVLTVTKLDGGMYGGKAALSGKASSSGKEHEPIMVAGKAALDDVSLESFVGSFSGARLVKAKGTVSVDADISTAGISTAALISGLTGSGKASGKDLIFEGFDLARLSRTLAQPTSSIKGNLGSLLDTTMSGGVTSFDTLASAFAINEGVVTVNPLTLTGKDATVTAPATVNLPLWTIDMEASIKLTEPKDAPPLKAVFRGPLDNPGQTFGRSALEGYVGTIVGSQVEDLLTKQLQKSGILPKAAPVQPVAPPQEQQPAAGDGTVQPQTQAAPEPQEQPVKPEDALMGILQGVIQQGH